MKRLTVYIFIAVISQMLITGCNDQLNTQSNVPPPNDQELITSDGITVSEKAKQPDHNRYIVMFKEQPAGIANSQAAQVAVEKTNNVFSNLNIPRDSLIHQYKWSSQGFAGHFTKEQVEKLRKHPLVDHVAKDYYYKAI